MKTRKTESGAALVYAMALAFIASVLCSLSVTYSSASVRLVQTKRYKEQARYLAEGGLEAAKYAVSEAIASWDVPPAEGSITIDGHEVTYTITPHGDPLGRVDPDGLRTQIRTYEIAARAQVREYRAQANRLIEARAMPMLQFAVFYENDLEIHNGAEMEIKGRVHTNSDLYVGTDSKLKLNTNYVRAIEKLHHFRKSNRQLFTGRVDIRRWVANPNATGEPAVYEKLYTKRDFDNMRVESQSGFDSHFQQYVDLDGDGEYDLFPWMLGALDAWGAPQGYSAGSGFTVLTDEHGVTRSAPPPVESINAYEEASGGDFIWDEDRNRYVPTAPGTGTHRKGYFHRTADLVILADPGDETWRAYDGNGNDVSAMVASAVSIRRIYDARQANGSTRKLKLVEIEMSRLNTSGRFPRNGILYAAWQSAGEGTEAHGVRIQKASKLGNDLTIVSQNSLYLEGDYNTQNKKPSAVIADAVNLLSNAWDDSKTRGRLPRASKTTYNVAIVSGNSETIGSEYGGGLENFPRFHEDWSGVDCNIMGSFVCPWPSRYATGTWIYGADRYTAPNRNWSFDQDFNDVSKLPPGTPVVVSVHDVVSW